MQHEHIPVVTDGDGQSRSLIAASVESFGILFDGFFKAGTLHENMAICQSLLFDPAKYKNNMNITVAHEPYLEQIVTFSLQGFFTAHASALELFFGFVQLTQLSELVMRNTNDMGM